MPGAPAAVPVDFQERAKAASSSQPDVLKPTPDEFRRRFLVEEKLGSGAFAEVYKATFDGAPVALKALRQGKHKKEQVLMFFNEARALKLCRHRSCVKFFNLVQIPPGGLVSNTTIRWAIMQEYLEGGSISNLVQKQMRHPNKQLYTDHQAVEWCYDVAGALAHLHSMDPPMIHRDVKQDNVMLAYENGKLIAKLGDFGLHTVVDRRKTPMLRMPSGRRSEAGKRSEAGSVAPSLADLDSSQHHDSASSSHGGGNGATAAAHNDSAASHTDANSSHHRPHSTRRKPPSRVPSRSLLMLVPADMVDVIKDQVLDDDDDDEAVDTGLGEGVTAPEDRMVSFSVAAIAHSQPHYDPGVLPLKPCLSRPRSRGNLERLSFDPHLPGSPHSTTHGGAFPTSRPTSRSIGESNLDGVFMNADDGVSASSSHAAMKARRPPSKRPSMPVLMLRDEDAPPPVRQNSRNRSSMSTSQKGTADQAAMLSAGGGSRRLKRSLTQVPLDELSAAWQMVEQGEELDFELVFNLTGTTGSYLYMAPEVFLDQPYNEKADVFSFGVVMYELLTRSLLLFTHTPAKCLEDAQEYARKVSTGFRPELQPSINPVMWDIIQRCWATEPLDRPDMMEVAEQLETWLKDQLKAPPEPQTSCHCCIC